MNNNSLWTCALELNAQREKISGGEQALCNAIRQAAELRIYTEFLHNEHIDTASSNTERIREVAEFGVTYLLDDRWAAGIMSLRQPISLPDGFGQPPSMSFFIYNQNAQQAVARPHLDGVPHTAEPGASPPTVPENMPKFHTQSQWDDGTNAPSRNFIYDFDMYRFNVWPGWREVLMHDAQGRVEAGSLDDLVEAFSAGCAVKVGVRNLCAPLGGSVDHEVFVQCGAGYYYTERRLFMTGSHPVVRVKPAIPLLYETRGWDFGWLMLRTDGRVVYRRCDPYTLAFSDIEMQLAVRWFVR